MADKKSIQSQPKYLAYDIIKYPLSTEKSVRLMESENKLVFVVDNRASKLQIKESIEKLFSVKVESINLLKDAKNTKKAYVRLSQDKLAIDVATDLGIL